MSREEEIRSELFEHTLNGHAPEVKALTEEALTLHTDPEKFVEAVQKHEPDIVGFSAFLTTTMPMFKANIEALQKAGLREKVHVAVGGAPVTEEYAKHVGADSYAPDASMATRMAKQLVGDRSGQSQGAQALEQAVMKIDETLRKG